MDFREHTVAGLADLVRRREIAARELTQGALDAIEARNGVVNAFVAVDGDAALAAASALDELIAAGEEVGPLAGIPLGVKDLEDAAGFVTTEGSPAHANDAPATADSPLVERLRAAGCIVIGKTNTPEFGWKADTENPVFGATRNPWELSHSAGGSSGGSAAAIAAGLVPLCTGSDGGGSIRIPSAINGLSGIKTSLGRVPGGGPHAPGWHHLSTKGPMARTIRDVTLALDACIGPEATDLRSLPMPEASWSRSLADVGAPRKVGWSPTLGYATVDREVRDLCEAAVNKLADQGTEIIEIDRVFDADPALDWITLAYTYNLRSLGHHRGTPLWDNLDPGLVRWMEWSIEHVGAVDLIRAEDRCHELNLKLVEIFHEVPLLMCPVTAGQTGPIGGQGSVNGTPTESWVAFTYPFNMTRNPAGTVCAGLTEAGLPVGLQVIGPQHADVVVLRALALLEDLIGFDQLASAV